jgi:hypothetical protein
MDELEELEDEFPGRRLKTKGKRKKPYTIEIYWNTPFFSSYGWHIWARYETLKQRDQAFKILSKRDHPWAQYRKGN